MKKPLLILGAVASICATSAFAIDTEETSDIVSIERAAKVKKTSKTKSNNNNLCPAGCFCLDNAENYQASSRYPIDCSESARRFHWVDASTGRDFAGKKWLLVSHNTGVESDITSATFYYIDDFSELYEGVNGMYGITKAARFVELLNYNADSSGNEYVNPRVFECPFSYPESEPGAKAVTECFKYDSNGNKIYYYFGKQISANKTNAVAQKKPSAVKANRSATQMVESAAVENDL